MPVLTTNKPRKSAQNGSVSPSFATRLGPMTSSRKRETEPSYVRVLRRFLGFDERANLQTAWALWQRVCVDPEVIRLSMKREAKNVPQPSVTAPYKQGAKVLAAMSEHQLAALRERVGVAK